MTEAEEKRRLQQGNQQTTEEGTTKSLDQPGVSKMVSRPQAKK
jgi:hypothetical protein